jgi:signal transduction histidine kinase
VTEGSAFSRHLRIAAIATGCGSVVFSLLGLADMVDDARYLALGFAVTSVALFSGLPIAMAILAWRGRLEGARWVARAHTVVTLLIILLWIPFQVYGRLPNSGAPWILNISAVAAGTAAIGWRARLVWVYVLGIALAGAALRYADLGGFDFTVPLEDGLSMLEFSVVIAMLLLVTLRVGRVQDVGFALAVAESRAAAEARSQARQRSRFAALLHDDVLTSLTAAAQASHHNPAIDRSAERAITRLGRFLEATSDELPLDAELLEIEVRSAVTDVVGGVEFAGSFQELGSQVPGAVAIALVGAMGEAARNSVRHGGGGVVRREVRMWAELGRVAVEFRDDGPGFDPQEVQSSRFGIRISIRARVEDAGGIATIVSAPGAGTSVTVAWPGGAR